ncbi:RNA deprotection pyrophosphohydrolase [Niallia sp.]|uniref:RNA deprotection pyrophosphohydrolase n=1 Tax=Niallia sp. TaxID=2837523 RepID=UPI00289F2A20|nr:nucleoside triphosphatase YtkD [Niallia sp.]
MLFALVCKLLILIIHNNGEGMEIFYDQNKNLVKLSFIKNDWKQEAKHVLVICQYKNQWLLTAHKQRGLEFPGGKSEKNETIIQTAHREVMEETGGVIESLQWIAAYQVSGEKTFVKDVFFAKIGQLNLKDDYQETMGPVLVNGDIMKMRWHPSYSFIMKDNVIKFCLSYIENELLNQKKG